MGEQERRKHKRIGMDSEITVKRVDGNGEENIQIHIYNISMAGLGFYCEEPLQMSAIYDSTIILNTKEVIHALLRVVRVDIAEEGYDYGATFLGLSDTDAFRISVYDVLEQAKKTDFQQQ